MQGYLGVAQGVALRLPLGVALGVALLMGQAAAADVLSSKSRVQLFKSQTSILDGRASQQYNSSVRLQPQAVVVPTKFANMPFTGSYKGPYLDVARSAAKRHGVPEELFLRLVQQESGWRVDAQSHKGALGLAQLMPATAQRLSVDPLDPADNLEGGARYLAQQYRSFGNWRLALAAYNAGPEAVRKYGDIPPYKETQNYVKVIWGY